MVDSTGAQVAVFIDYQNLRSADWVRIMAEAEKVGRVVIKRAYADWTRHHSDHHTLLNLGVDVEQVSSKRGKNAADIRIAIDAMDVLLDKRTNITHVFLVSGDGDFTDLVNRLKFYGKIVIGVGTKEATADYLREACDAYIYYEDLITVKKLPTPSVKPTPRRPRQSINQARNLLRQVLEAKPTEWISGGRVKQEMRQIAADFDEGNFGFNSFLSFVNEMKDVAETRYAEGGHTEIRLHPSLRQGEKLSLSEARRLVVESLRSQPEQWTLSAQLKQRIRQWRNNFDEGELGYKRFNDFLEAQTDLLETQRDDAQNLRVRLLPDTTSLTQLPAAQPTAVSPAPSQLASPETAVAPSPSRSEAAAEEALIDQYIRFLRQQRVHITPSEHRARIILKIYELFHKQPPEVTLDQFQEELVAYFGANYPAVPETVVVEVLFQLFWARCFEFDPDDGRYPSGTKLWNKRTTLSADVSTRAHLIDKCDRFLLCKIAERVGGPQHIDRNIAMELLYGRVGSAQMRQHVDKLLQGC